MLPIKLIVNKRTYIQILIHPPFLDNIYGIFNVKIINDSPFLKKFQIDPNNIFKNDQY